jgi:alginate O-acetyltransferase complex protein AlgI
MVFSDPVFVYFFLPACLAIYWLGGWRRRNMLICAAGTVFYMWAGGALILLLLGTTIANYFAARQLAVLRLTRPDAGRWLLRLIVAADVASLAVWKYGGFAAEQSARLMRSLGLEATWSLQLVLPIAISFFTFQCVSYVVDCWRGTASPARRLVDFSAYILLFPHLIAGPIVRYADIEGDLLTVPRRRLDDFAIGAPRFFWGLAKKVLIADQVSGIANAVFALPDARVTSVAAWIGVLAYAIQIYFDFSGYSDMAIGLARMFGFVFPENFNRPYSAVSITDFWRRWHMSLSTWFRDYVYFPLGGSRSGSGRTYLNLSIVFLLTGMWHGADWTFLAWGTFHGVCLIVERVTGVHEWSPDRLVAIRRVFTFALVCVGWAMFRAADFAQGATFVRSLVSPQGLGITEAVSEAMTTQRIVWLVIGCLVLAVPRSARPGYLLSTGTTTIARRARLATVAVIAPIVGVYVLSSTFSPFLYFKF